MKIKYRTYQDGDDLGIVKLFNSTFYQNRFCQYMTAIEMIKPFSKEFIQVYDSLKKLKKPWVTPLEQEGF